MLARYLEPMLAEGIDTLVLGCTHYPLLAPAIQRQLKEKVALVDSAKNCALAVQRFWIKGTARAGRQRRAICMSL